MVRGGPSKEGPRSRTAVELKKDGPSGGRDQGPRIRERKGKTRSAVCEGSSQRDGPRPCTTGVGGNLPAGEAMEGRLWTEVVGRKAKRLMKREEEKKSSKGKSSQALVNVERKKRRKPPKTAAVTCPEGRYGEVMRMTRRKVNLAALGIDGLRPRRESGV